MARLVESFTKQGGVNTFPAIYSLAERNLFCKRAVNRSFDGLVNQTRPSYLELKLTFPSLEDENIFRNGAVSGDWFYKGGPPNFSSFYIIAVGNIILAGVVRSGAINFFKIYDQLDPQWQHAYFSQALNILTYNNGKDRGIYWSGNPLEMMKSISESTHVEEGYAMPVSNISIYAHGRFWVADSNNIVRASDYIGADGLDLEDRESVLNFKEDTYPNSTSGFTPPAEMGSIIGMSVTTQSSDVNGHGPIVVQCTGGAFAISPGTKPRNTWADDPSMQQIAYMGKGGVSHLGLTTFNNNTLYRDTDNGISSIQSNISSFQRMGVYANFSDEIQHYLNYDRNSAHNEFCMAVSSGKRMLMSVSHIKEKSILGGVHRYANGIVSASMQKNQRDTFMLWDGLWTGPRPVAMSSVNLSGREYFLMVSYGKDKINRIFQLTESRRTGYDTVDGVDVPIDGYFTTPNAFFRDEQNSELGKVTLSKVEYLLKDSNGLIDATYTPDFGNDEFDIEFQDLSIKGCGSTTIHCVSDDTCGKGNKKKAPTNLAYCFDVNVYTSKLATFAKFAILSENSNSSGFNRDKCEDVTTEDVSEICFDEKSQCSMRSDEFTYTY